MSIKGFITNFILEQDDNLVTITPDQYLELLDNVGGVAERVSKLKPYKGKGIVINGNLDLRKYKSIGPLTGVVRVMGRLDISDTNVPHLNGVTVDGYTSDYKSTMWKRKIQSELNKKFELINSYREEDRWDVKNGDDESERTEALYSYIVNDGIAEDVENPETGEKTTQDKYYIYPDGKGTYGYGKQYEWLGNNEYNPNRYDVYTSEELDYAARVAVEQLVEDVGFNAFKTWVWEDSVDEETWSRWLYDFYYEDIINDPEGFEVPLTLSTTQQAQVQKLKNSIKLLEDKIKNEDLSEDQLNIIRKKIEGFQNIIEDINEDPQGEYDDDYINDYVKSRVDEYDRNISGFISDYGFEKDFIMSFIDMDELTETLVQHDGYGNFLSNSGEDMYEELINGTRYYVIPMD